LPEEPQHVSTSPVPRLCIRNFSPCPSYFFFRLAQLYLTPNIYDSSLSTMDLPRPKIHWDPRERQGAHYQEVAPEVEARLEARPRHAELDSIIEDSTPNVLSPYDTSASVRILDLATTMTVTLSFLNPTDCVIREGYFSFPLPSSCSLTRFRFFIGDNKVINSKVKPLLNAAADFTGALHNRKTTALIKEGTAEIFTALLGNLPPQTKLKAEVSLVMMLKEKIPDKLPTRISTLSIPTYIAPRYGKPPTAYLQETAYDLKAEHVLSITTEAIFSDEVMDVISRTHDISYELRRGPRPTHSWEDFVRGDSLSQEPSNIVTVKLKKPLSVLDGDFVLDFVTKPSTSTSTPHAYLEQHPTLHDHQALMLTIPSNVLVDSDRDADDSEVLLLADLSSSMLDKRSSLKSAMKFFLNGIPLTRRFNIWSFGSTYSSLWPQSQAKSKDSLGKALEHVDAKFDRDLGGTELLPALKEMFNSRSSERPFSTTDILLLTDGEVWCEEETTEFINSARRHSGYRVRFFCLGIGDAVSHSLIEGIAKAGGGYSEAVAASLRMGWEDRVVLMLKAALYTHIGPVEINIGEETSSGFRPWANKSFLRSPTDTSMLSPFVTNKVLMLFEATRYPISRAVISLKITNSSGREQVWKIKPILFHTKEPVIHQLAGRELLKDLEHGRHWLIHPSEDSLRREGERIACKWSLVSKWTCLVAVEESQSNSGPKVLSDTILESIDALSRIQSEEWNPDLLRPVGGRRTALAFRKRMSIKIDSGSESSSDSDSEIDSGDEMGNLQPTSKRDEPDEGSGAGTGDGPSGSRAKSSGNSGSMPSRAGSGDTGGTERSQNKPSCGGSTRSHEAQQANRSAIRQTSKENKAPKITHEHLQNVIKSLGWPATLQEGSHSNVRDGTIERPCSIRHFVITNQRSGPIVPSPILNSQLSNRVEDEEEDLNKRALIQTLIALQSFSGSFIMADPETDLVGMFGENIGSVLNDVQIGLSVLLGHQNEPRSEYFDMALAVLIVALLREHFDLCQSLWSLMVDNVISFLKNWLVTEFLAVGVEDVIRIAEVAIRGVEVKVKKRPEQHPPPAPPQSDMMCFCSPPPEPEYPGQDQWDLNFDPDAWHLGLGLDARELDLGQDAWDLDFEQDAWDSDLEQDQGQVVIEVPQNPVQSRRGSQTRLVQNSDKQDGTGRQST
ncbi:hypothetical protein KAF25_005400, partial [Fusarium avenaceum]